MARIEKSIDIDASPENVWKVVGDVGGISGWVPALASSSHSDGVRQCSLEGGGDLREEIMSIDKDARRVDYRITDSPMPIEDHVAWISVAANDAGSRVTWVTDVTPDELAPALEPIFDGGLASLKAQLEQS